MTPVDIFDAAWIAFLVVIAIIVMQFEIIDLQRAVKRLEDKRL